MSDVNRKVPEVPEEQDDLWQEPPRRRITLRGVINLLAVLMLIAVVSYIVADSTKVPQAPGGSTPIYTTTQPTTTEEPTTAPTTEPTTEIVTEEPTTEEPTEPALEAYEELAIEILSDMTLEEKLWQLLFITQDELTDVYGPTMAGEGTREALSNYPVGGVIYFDRNLKDADQIRSLLANTQSYSEIPLFLGVDEEGGMVSRLSGVGVTDRVSSMATYGEAGDKQAVYELGRTFADQLLGVGFNLDFAPVADVVTNPNNTEIGNRSFSGDPVVAGEMVAEMVKGLQEGGVISCLKHFPGHGSTSADSHYGMSVSYRTLEELRAEEFLPFVQGIEAGAELVMISHMSLPNVTGDNTPCDLSYTVVTELLRQELGFEGLIFSDSHEMASITSYYSCGEAAVLAIAAGCDVVLMPMDKQEAFDGLLDAVKDGTLTVERINQSVLRILTLKCKYGIIPADF